jgi:hypothetical protein
MPDPISIAMMSMATIKTGLKLGKDFMELSKDLGKVWDGIEGAKAQHTQARKSKRGVNEQALQTYMASVKARDLEEELRRIILETRGMKGWRELQKIKTQIQKEDERGRYLAIKRREAMFYWFSVILGVGIIASAVVGMVYFALYLKENQ